MIIPPSGAALKSAATPDNLLDLLTGVSGSPEVTSLDDALLVLLVGVFDKSSLRGVACFNGVMCLGRDEALSGVVGVLVSIFSEAISVFFDDLLVLLGVITLGLSGAAFSESVFLLDLLDLKKFIYSCTTVTVNENRPCSSSCFCNATITWNMDVLNLHTNLLNGES